jgi:amino-acid N-acetyltransferase
MLYERYGSYDNAHMPTQSHIQWFRNTTPYINAHRGKTFVVALSGECLASDHLTTILQDLVLLNSLGVRVVIAFGARPQVNQTLQKEGRSSLFEQDLRITDSPDLELIKHTVGSLRHELEAKLSMGLPNSPMQGAKVRVCSGNFVMAQPVGVLNGTDYLHTGKVRRIDVAGITRQLNDSNLVLLPPLGYSPTGESFNLSLEDVAVRVATDCRADKLIWLMSPDAIHDSGSQFVRQLAVSELDDCDVSKEYRVLLDASKRACAGGVERCHIIGFEQEGALLNELFTHDGAGTLVSRNLFEQCRQANIDDVGGILELLQPLEAEGVLVKRSRELLETEIAQFTVLERDGRVIACAALYVYPDASTAEVACIVCHPDYRGSDRGQRLLDALEKEAQKQRLDSVFVLTTQTAHWFIEQGFREQDRFSLPQPKQALYNLQRNSKVFVKPLAV